MAGDKMEVDAAEAKLKAMEHSEQHYFKRCVWPLLPLCSLRGAAEGFLWKNADQFCVLQLRPPW